MNEKTNDFGSKWNERMEAIGARQGTWDDILVVKVFQCRKCGAVIDTCGGDWSKHCTNCNEPVDKWYKGRVEECEKATGVNYKDWEIL